MSAGETVAVLGAGGTMGQPMARNIAQAGIGVRAWNRSHEKAEPLAGKGIEVFDRAAEAASGAGVILTIVSDADAARGSLPQNWMHASSARISRPSAGRGLPFMLRVMQELRRSSMVICAPERAL